MKSHPCSNLFPLLLFPILRSPFPPNNPVCVRILDPSGFLLFMYSLQYSFISYNNNNNKNIYETPTVSRSYTLPSHSQTSRLFSSSLSRDLGLSFPRVTQCVRGFQILQFQCSVTHNTDTPIYVFPSLSEISFYLLYLNKNTKKSKILNSLWFLNRRRFLVS